MPRTVPEWIGATDNTPPSAACKRRILDRQDNKCASTGMEFTPQDPPFFDHKVPVWLGGENRESNLQAIRGEPHQRKTSAEATVRSKVNANRDRHLGLKKTRRPMPGSKASGWKKKMNGEVVRR